MTTELGLYFRSKEHRGCGIRPASFKAGPKNWIPEACVSLKTETGAKRLWVRSFAHCFAGENMTFPNKLEADNWALDAARAIIDKALPDFEPIGAPRTPLYTPKLSRFLRLARRPLVALCRASLFCRG